MNTYRIHEANLDRLHSKVNRIRNKCAKYGCDFHYAEIGEEFETWFDEQKQEHVDKYIIVECEGTARINDWEFVGTIDFLEAGNVIRQALDISVPDRYRTCECECEHCHSHRHRKNTYIVHNTKTGEFKQVGSSCVADFTGGLSVEEIAMYISFYDELIDFGERPVGSSWSKRYFKVDDILKYATGYIDHLGYVSTSVPYNSTKEQVLTAWAVDNEKLVSEANKIEVKEFRDKFHIDLDSPELLERVAAMKAYVLSVEDETDYIKNIKVLVQSEYIDGKQVGYVCYIPAMYNKHIEYTTEKERRAAEAEKEKVSEFQGDVGDRLTIWYPEYTVITSWENQFGTTIRYKITDGNNNVYMWDSSTFIETDRPLISIKGTVKKLDTFNGVKQTWLTRCRLEYGRRPTSEDIHAAEDAGISVTEYLASLPI